MKARPIFIVILVLSLTLLSAIFVYPNLFDKNYKFSHWKLGLDLIGGSHLVYEVDLSGVSATDRDSVVNGLRDVIEKRVNLFGVSEPQVYVSKSGESSRLIAELAGIKDVKAAIEQIGATPFLYFAEETKLGDIGQEITAYKHTDLTGRYITGAKLDFDSTLGAPQISLSFNSEGAKIFEELTERLVGKPLAIFLDDSLIQSPIVQEKISGGRAQITGRFTIKEAKQIVERFNAGALPAPIKLISQQTIGASLGK
ncbi:MAG: protein translocase subunit SecD, partial [Patescibacteria group bacterium]